MTRINIIVSAIAGIGSFFSPCILPILSAFISSLSDITINEIGNIKSIEKSSHNKNIDIINMSSNSNNSKKYILLQISTRINIISVQ